MRKLSPKYLHLVCSGKIIPVNVLWFLITTVLYYAEDYNYKKFFSSIKIDDEDVDVEELAPFMFDKMFTLSVVNKKLLTQLVAQMNVQLSSLFLNDLVDILNSYETTNEEVLSAIENLARAKINIKRDTVKATVMASGGSSNVNEDDLLW